MGPIGRGSAIPRKIFEFCLKTVHSGVCMHGACNSKI